MAKKEIEHTSTTLGNQDMKSSQRMVSVVEPYELPEGWKWVKVGEVAEIINGKNQKEVEDENGIYPIYGSGGIIGRATDFICPENCTIIGRKGTINNPIFVETKFWNVDTAFGMKTFDCVAPKFYFYFCKSFNFLTLDSSTAIPSLTKSNIQQIPFPLPPTLAEQQRIVNRIESMFAKLDEAKEKAQNVVDVFETRKAAILHKAFTGELTAKWRKENGVSDDSWEKKFLKDICSKITDGTHNSPVNTETGDFKYITAKNIKESGIDLTNITFVSKEVHQEIYARCNVEKGDVLYIKDGATTGIAAVNTLDEEFSMLSSVADLKPINGLLDSKYLAYVLNSSEIKAKMLNEMSGNAITRLTLVKIKKSEIPVCSFSEQQEIVRILDSVLEKERTVKQAAEKALEQIDLLKKSILARAFRGEL